MSSPPVVVITGASSGVGRATARRFAEDGASVGLLARNGDGLEAAAKEIEAAGGSAVVARCDMADPEQVEAAAQTVEESFGPLDVWVNNAMVTVYGEVADMEPEEFRRVTEVTYLGSVYGTLTALRRMLPRDAGTIVQVGSALAYRAIPLQSAYCGAKFATRGFVDALRVELRHRGSGVRITHCHLPGLNTPQFERNRSKLTRQPQPMPPICQPELAGEAIVHAARHPDRREYRVGTSSVLTILGNKIAPGLLDRYLARSAYGSQHTDEVIDPDRPDNLFSALDGDPGARGPFDDRARRRDPQVALMRHRTLVGALGVIGGLGSLLYGAVRRRR